MEANRHSYLERAVQSKGTSTGDKTDHISRRGTEGGQAVLIAVIFFVFISLSLILMLSAPALSHLKGSSSLYSSLRAFNMAESGAEDVVYRLMKGESVANPENLNTKSGSATVESIGNGGGLDVLSEGTSSMENIRRVLVDLQPGVGIGFAYAVQVGNGGLVLENSSNVEGNVFSLGSVKGSSNNIFGSVIVAGDGGVIGGVNIYGSGSAYRIENSHIDVDAHYMEISNTTVLGNMYPNSETVDPVEFPISESVIDGWKEFAVDGGTIDCNGTYVIDSSVSLGPVHITCNLEIRGNHTVTLGGHVWVEGDIEVRNSPVIKVDSSLGDESVVFIADDPADRIDSSTISLGQSSSFEGAEGSDRSFVFMVSLNEAAFEGYLTPAITDGQAASGDVFMYAEKGEILISNNIHITGLTAYRIRARNSATITYQEGLADTYFSTGPSAGYSIFAWEEVE